MYETITVSCDIVPTDASAPLGLLIMINDQTIFDSAAISAAVKFTHTITLAENQEHELKIQLKNKSAGHTVIDAQGNIVKDSAVQIKNLAFDDIDLGQIVQNNSVYVHDFNGNGALTHDKFYDTMGCNGTVSMKFTTPVYLWLLEQI